MLEERITKAWHSAEFLYRDIADAHSIAPDVATEIVLYDMLAPVVAMRDRLKRLALAADGNEE